MKAILITTIMFTCVMSCFAEMRVIGIQVSKAPYEPAKVAITSDVKEEKKHDLTIDQAGVILRNAKGWGSSVLVGIIAHDVPVREYLPLLEAVSVNFWLNLAFVEGRKPDYIFDNIKEGIKKQSADKPPAPQQSERDRNPLRVNDSL